MSEIHVISENDLESVKKSGKRLRALCPIHKSRDRDLSLNPALDYYLDEDEEKLAGFGHCHSANCGATVLVQEWNPRAASRILGRPVQVRQARITMTSKEIEQAEEWQRQELAALNKIYPFAVLQLRHMRAYAYLAQRGLGDQSALDMLTSLEVGYIPPAEEWRNPPPGPLKHWCDRVIFPFSCAGGERGYIGRSLRLWQPGMDENEHKRLLNEHDARMEEEHGKDAGRYQIRRWRKTYKSGFFNAAIMPEYRHIYMCEGPFDAVPLLLAGLPAVAVAGTHIYSLIDEIKSVKRLYDVTLAFDLDVSGKEAIEKMSDQLRGIGVEPAFLVPPSDQGGKDWSERYRRSGLAGLAVLLEADRARQGGQMASQQVSGPADHEQEDTAFPEQCEDCGAHITLEDGRNFFFLAVSESQAHCYCDRCRDPESGDPCQDDQMVSEPSPVEQEITAPEEIPTSKPVDIINAPTEPITAPTRQFSPEEIAATFAKALPDWDIAIVSGTPTYDIPAQAETQERDFWQWVTRQNAEPPRYHIPVFGPDGKQLEGKSTPIYNDDGKQVGVQPGNKVFKLGKPMMSREEWAKLRVQQLAWRPDPALLAHRSQKS